MALDETIKSIYGSGVCVKRRVPVSGGDINRAYALELSDGSKVFMKANSRDAEDMFRAEAKGLDAIRQTGAIRVPRVVARGTDGREAFLLLESIDAGRGSRTSSEALGEGLARMHLADTSKFVAKGRFGFAGDNYIGASRQINTPADSWKEFFIEYRLRPQFERAHSYVGNAERFLSRIGRYLTEPDKPALLHGDLWAGNYMIDRAGHPWLIDPACYVGHPEADLAMTELFGGFDRAFYDAYDSTAGIDPGYRDRRDLYNLYHLLNHLNLFGGGYLYSVRSIINRFI